MHTNNAPDNVTVKQETLGERPKTHGSCPLRGYNDAIV